jgi:hypothetical protein
MWSLYLQGSIVLVVHGRGFQHPARAVARLGGPTTCACKQQFNIEIFNRLLKMH